MPRTLIRDGKTLVRDDAPDIPSPFGGMVRESVAVKPEDVEAAARYVRRKCCDADAILAALGAKA